MFLGGSFSRANYVGNKSPERQFSSAAISRRILPGGNYLWGNYPGAIIQGAISSGAIVRGAITWAAIIQGAVVRGTIFLEGNCPYTCILMYAPEMMNDKTPRKIFLKNATDDSVNENCTLPIFTLRKHTKIMSETLNLKTQCYLILLRTGPIFILPAILIHFFLLFIDN